MKDKVSKQTMGIHIHEQNTDTQGTVGNKSLRNHGKKVFGAF
jgi:hypothetical protein